MTSRTPPALLAFALGLLLFTACNYDGPLTAQPTQPIDRRLLGDWETKDGDKIEKLLVRELDASSYVLMLDGDLYRAFHSDFAGLPFVSVQNLKAGTDDRKYTYVTWRLSADGRQLVLRAINPNLIHPPITTTPAMQRQVSEKIKDPSLLGEELVYRRPSAAQP